MIFSTQMLVERYNNYVNPNAKIKREVKEKKLFETLYKEVKVEKGEKKTFSQLFENEAGN